MIKINKNKKATLVQESTFLTLRVPAITRYKKNALTEEEFKGNCGLAILQVLLKMGIKSLHSTTIKEWRKELNILPQYDALFQTIIEELERMSFIQIGNQSIVVPENIEEKAVLFSLKNQAIKAKREVNPYQSYYELLNQTISSFEEILKGKTKGTDVLFPEGNSGLVSAIYNGDYRSDYFNSIVASILENTIRNHEGSDQKINILEIGGGTGGTTVRVVEELKKYANQITYTFTDVSQSFLIAASERFQETLPFFETKRFDITQSASMQDIKMGSYDIVIGANVIHATANIADTLKNIKPILKKDGILIINELSALEMFTTLTFGLLSDWWNHEDKELRISGSPALTFDKWKQVLSEVGFADCDVYPKQEDIPQQIITARSNGRVLIDTQVVVEPAKIPAEKTVKEPVAGSLKGAIDLNDFQEELIAIAAGTIKLPLTAFKKEKPFSDYGFDSILGLTLIKNINKALEITLDVTAIFNYPTIPLLAQHIADIYPDLLHAKEKIADQAYEVVEAITEKVVEEPDFRKIDNTQENDKIAIIGMSGQFGKANSLEEFWEVLKNGESLVEEVPNDRWDIALHFDENPKARQKTYSKWGSFLRDIDKFDPEFFKISGKEAENMDPQQRIFLQHCWKALEDAAIDPTILQDSKCGVYVGATDGDYYKTYLEEANEASAFWGISGSILAARISYFLNLKGAAVAIDTACSSSLVAMDMGCKSLLTKETDLIITGGISLSVTPEFYKLSSMAGMLSPDGQCYTFDERANGFVPGEGVGVIVMKRLDDAIRDGDPIYAVVQGILTNQDGATNGITAPSVLSQQDIQKEVFTKYNINPETITYVEAHGTGTKLGDPIELQALKASFKEHTSKVNYCGIGSVKTNVGHTLRAAGMAGIMKVLLAMKNKQLPPSINYEKLNQHIQLKDSPFVIQEKLTSWNSETPKRASVSSFGISGTNAFVVLEEYIQKNSISEVSDEPMILVLSALNEERLKVKAAQLAYFIEKEKNLNLTDIAYTLQVGRKVMECRKAFVVSQIDELVVQLQQFAQEESAGVYLKENIVNESEIQQAIYAKQYETIAKYWEQGNAINWLRLYTVYQPKKIHLPTYIFAKESYWITPKTEILFSDIKRLHPLVHENRSNFESQKFSSLLTAEETIISDHIVQGKKILPGVAYIEMAREAVQQSGLDLGHHFSDIKWLQPIEISKESAVIETEVYMNTEGVFVEIKSIKENKVTTHFQAGIGESKEVTESFYRDIASIEEQSIKSYSADQCYQIFSEKGINYGNSLQLINAVAVLEEEVLASISVFSKSKFKLPVEILDNALQTVALLWLQNSEDLALPYAIENISCYNLEEEIKYCYAYYSDQKEKKTFEVELLSATGKVLIVLSGYKMMPVLGGIRDIAQTYLYESVWQPKLNTTNIFDVSAVFNEFIVVGDFPKVELEGSITRISEIEERELFSAVFDKVKQVMTSRTPVRLVIVYDYKKEHEVQFLSGLLRTAAIENPKVLWKCVGIDLDKINDAKQLSKIITDELNEKETLVRYHDLKREVKIIVPVAQPLIESNDSATFIDGGVYIITGGMGGVGKILLEYLFETYTDIKIIASGRSLLDSANQEYVKAFKNLTYYRCDITNKLATQQLIDEVQNQYGKLNGIIHAAGSINDNFIQQKTSDEALQVLEVKTKGIRNLHEATQHIPLDFVILFSSLAAVLGNSGQGDYAAANEYLRDFSKFRNKEVAQQRAFGKTISIAWPLWDSSGMQLNVKNRELLEKKLNIVPLPKKEGIYWLEKLISGTIESAVLHYGRAPLPETLLSDLKETPESSKDEKNGSETGDLTEEKLKEIAYRYLITVFAEELRFPESKFKITDTFEKYGLDSIMMTSLTNRLEETFPDIPKTLFFEFLTIEELVVFFIEEYSSELNAIGNNRKESIAIKEQINIAPEIKPTFKKGIPQKFVSLSETKQDYSKKNNDVAIVGLSGRYPQADTIEEFWENLKIGKDCITEIPGDRWDIDGFFDAAKGKSGYSYSKWGGFVNDMDKFDPLFFNITPLEAEKIDPQERLFLQIAWEAVEDAGYTQETLKRNPFTGKPDGKVGVYVGVMYQEYQLYGVEETLKGNSTTLRGSASSIANRISYVFDIHGPSLALDTMCSSSSTAIHLACKAIQEGEIHAAIAGGVNLSVHPNKYLMLSDGGFASSKGRCESFGEGGDGYVPGEGVGAILLKSLEQAEKDGDHIYGVIKGSALNHGGKTTGYTVPNPKAQTAVISEAIEKANINADSISYIEAHGTGTSLGDPIEIVGLKNALARTTANKCRIGSVKSNIGHCESAAGISGITKVLLQLKHKQLVPSIHSAVLNPNIQFDQTAFLVQQELEPWSSQNEELLTAGISSFGAGGSNAHILIQEYPKAEITSEFNTEPVIIVLSAKNKNRLKAYASRLVNYIEKTPETLQNIAYTLQIGREAMSERLAIVASSKEELAQKLEDFIKNDVRFAEEVFTANIKDENTDFLLRGKAGAAYIKEAIQEKELASIAQLWAKGVEIKWELLNSGSKLLQKVSLPTYPFAKERYWVQTINTTVKQESISKLHPLLHTNESDFETQKFASVFTGTEWFLEDHLVQNEKVIAGVAYLEMAREAVERSIHQKVTQFKEVTWLHPIKVLEQPKKVGIRLESSGEQIRYQVYSKEQEEEYIHGQGIVTAIVQEVPEPYNLGVIRSRTNQTASRPECYKMFSTLGFGYGERFQGIQELYYNDTEALAKIELPQHRDMILDPGVLDSTLQACLAWLLLKDGNKMPLSIPFSVGKVTVYKEITFPVWSYARFSPNANPNATIPQCDMDLLNDKGDVVVRFKDFVILPYEGAFLNQKSGKESLATEIYKYQWEAIELEKTYAHITDYNDVVLVGATQNLTQQFSQVFEGTVYSIEEKTEETYFLKILELLKNRMSQKKRGHFSVVITDEDYDKYGFIIGMLKSASKENPRIKTKLVSIESLNAKSGNELAKILKDENTDEHAEVRYLNETREVKKAISVSQNQISDLKIKEGGVYLITGGVGGIGSTFATHIAKTKGTQLILTGRSAKNDSIQKFIESLPNAQYYACDVTRYEEVEGLLQTIFTDYRKIDGIIHCAGIGTASTIAEKTEAEVHKVLLPKMAGVKNLDKALQNQTLDFIMYCSSISSVLGDIGLSDYAAANAYMDHFAKKRNHLVKEGKRKGVTIAVNWGLWETGGMQANAESIEFLSKQWGMFPLPEEEGAKALDKALQLANEQLIIVYGLKNKLDKTFEAKANDVVITDKNVISEQSNEGLEAIAYEKIVEIFKKELKLKEEHIQTGLPFEEYGIDSMLVVKLTNRLGDIFDNVSVSLLFEYQTIDQLVSYFVKEHSDTLQTLKTTKEAPVLSVNKVSSKEEFSIIEAKEYKRFMQPKLVPVVKKQEIKSEDIAIIGLSGIYPGANNIAEFWENLKAGTDSITEIPEQRWNIREFYNEQKGKKGTSYSKWGGFIEDIDKFDPLFFNISPREASMMDPQERLFLQTAWHAIEDAGYTKEKLQNIGKKSATATGGNVGVFVGVMYEEYQLFGVEERLKGNFIAPTGNASSIANRVSYFLDLHGPSMAVATMCSSSLIAIQMACENIHLGNCEAAIAGGVNLSMHPGKYLMLSDLHLVSDKGKCETFGEGGDGYVPSEGVGAILLKSLAKAKEDGDQIYGVIKGGAINHGGKVNGYTVPNPNAQAAVISQAMEKAGVSAEAYSYIEAHGTGTKLGDPIEIAGLKKAFAGAGNQFCKIGSVKSNIGHSEAAAGISGVTKVLLQLKNKQLVPSLHSKKLNVNIDFENSPFQVQQELEDWTTSDGRPRIAGISSFGAGGTNVHLVIEEYEKDSQDSIDFQGPVIIPISAKDTVRLKEHVKKIGNYLEENKETLTITDIAYTLQTGREAMESRVAFVVTSIGQLIVKLKQYLEEPTTAIIGEIATNKLLVYKKISNVVEDALAQNDHINLAALWTQGERVDWNQLYEKTPNIIGLPNYPFAKEYCWFKPKDTVAVTAVKKAHPLVHEQFNTLDSSRFISTYSGSEQFLSEHVLYTEKILPGVAYLEMARVSGEWYIDKKIAQLRDVFWMSPLHVNGHSRSVVTELQKLNEEIVFTVKDEIEDHVIFNQGKISTSFVTQIEKLDTELISNRLPAVLYKEDYYKLFKELGFHYGTSFQRIEYIRYSGSEALAKISINQDLSDNYWTVQAMDSALQTCLGIHLKGDTKQLPLSIPFSVKEVNIYKELPSEFWSYVTVREREEEKNTPIHYDVKLIDVSGEVIMSFIDFVTLPFTNQEQAVSNRTAAYTQLYSYDWKSKSITENVAINSNRNYEVILAGSTSEVAERLTDELEIQVTSIQSQNEEEFFNTILKRVKQKLISKEETHFLIVFEEEDALSYSFVSGILKSVNKENPVISGKTIAVDQISLDNIDLLCKIISKEKNTEENEVRYLNSNREVREIGIYNKTPDQNAIEIKPDGVYIITGGAGGLGMIFANYLNQFKNTTLFLIGRSELAAEKQRDINALNNAKYIRCDVTDRKAISLVINEILREEGQINGIIHSAGIGTASQILKKTSEEIHKVLSPKIEATRILDEVTQQLPLDFMMYVSSISAIMGDIGLADYASANAYMDAYAWYRNQLVKEGKRYGKSITVNWGLWHEGGLQINEESRKYLEHYWAMLPLPTAEGIKALSDIFREAPSQIMVVYEKTSKLLEKKEYKKTATAANTSGITKEACMVYFRNLISEELQIEPERIGLTTPFETYGMDSIRIVKLTNKLNEDFDDIPNTLFFENPTLDDLVLYFMKNYSDSMLKVAGNQEVRQEVTADKTDFLYNHNEFKKQIEADYRPIEEPVAIIGVAGKYPGANTLEEFWENLRTGKDSITEIPKNRWNTELFFDKEKGKEGKTYSKWGGFVEDVDKFDPIFFSISPKEAELMDPQERLFLQTAWDTVEDAGYTPENLNQKVGVFVGVMYSEYAMFGIDAMHEGQFTTPKGIHSSIANRVSYVMNFEGPSMAIDTMCSSSLTAIHLACESIRKGECTTAIAGGVNLNLHPYKYLSLSSAGFVSSQGKCAAFGEGADGYVPGEGVGAVLLKPLSEAIKDNDQIYGVIRSTEINHGGRSNGFHVPNPNAQAKVIQKAIQKAGIEPHSLQYIEAHGTGTSLGDPIEIAGLSQALNMDSKTSYKIGSVKSNIGHCESAAGISGLTKILLQLKHKQIAPSIHSNILNKNIQFGDSPFEIQQELTDWTTTDSEKRRAGLSSFGAGGSNAHVILEEHLRNEEREQQETESVLIILSAKDTERLKQKAAELLKFLEEQEAVSLIDLAYTLQVGRVALESRLSIEVTSIKELKKELQNYRQDQFSGYQKTLKSYELNKANNTDILYKKALNNKDLDELAKLWIEGETISWEKLYANNAQPKRISLPTYPFVKKRYWLPEISEKLEKREKVSEAIHPLFQN
ncbi:SDR family NAD(P)-dependent oxidoreductase [Flavobacterium poyangense]|uniref:SDR family NAD(P)-dependent oxidoreductase n=1 Tax=Flavobacterium poyangense TaxID=2204302 RepID=UPI001423245E|nr:SDR family NAD(P)-dependent oxidoreductase [Flavobacterium sp. JXAS1]